MPFDSTSTSADIAEHVRATRLLTAEELQAADITRLRDRFAADFQALKPARRRSRIRPRHVFAVAFTAAVILIGWHMSDAFARAQADSRIIQSMEKIK